MVPDTFSFAPELPGLEKLRSVPGSVSHLIVGHVASMWAHVWFPPLELVQPTSAAISLL